MLLCESSSSSLRRNAFPKLCRTVVLASISTSWSPSIPWRPAGSALVSSHWSVPYCLCEPHLIMACAEWRRCKSFKGGLPHSPKRCVFSFFLSDSALCWYNCSLEECVRCLQHGPFFFRKRGGPVLCDVGVPLCSSVAIHTRQRRTVACSPPNWHWNCVAFQAATCWDNVSSKVWINNVQR